LAHSLKKSRNRPRSWATARRALPGPASQGATITHQLPATLTENATKKDKDY